MCTKHFLIHSSLAMLKTFNFVIESLPHVLWLLRAVSILFSRISIIHVSVSFSPCCPLNRSFLSTYFCSFCLPDNTWIYTRNSSQLMVSNECGCMPCTAIIISFKNASHRIAIIAMDIIAPPLL